MNWISTYKQKIYWYCSSLDFGKCIPIQKGIFTPTDNILTAINPWQEVEAIFCDLSKAFDCGNHETLLGKFNCYRIHGVNIKLFESCLTNRKQSVDIISQNHLHNFSSHWGAIKCGVPQRTVLGLLLNTRSADKPNINTK